MGVLLHARSCKVEVVVDGLARDYLMDVVLIDHRRGRIIVVWESILI
jgi:hypothetical protein